MRTVIKRLARLEEQFAPADRKPRKYYRLVVCKWGSKTGLEHAMCKRTLCPDGTLAELVEMYGSNEGAGRVTSEETDRWVASFPIQVLGMERAG
jgi:hypothetical protein